MDAGGLSRARSAVIRLPVLPTITRRCRYFAPATQNGWRLTFSGCGGTGNTVATVVSSPNPSGGPWTCWGCVRRALLHQQGRQQQRACHHPICQLPCLQKPHLHPTPTPTLHTQLCRQRWLRRAEWPLFCSADDDWQHLRESAAGWRQEGDLQESPPASPPHPITPTHTHSRSVPSPLPRPFRHTPVFHRRWAQGGWQWRHAPPKHAGPGAPLSAAPAVAPAAPQARAAWTHAAGMPAPPQQLSATPSELPELAPHAWVPTYSHPTPSHPAPPMPGARRRLRPVLSALHPQGRLQGEQACAG